MINIEKNKELHLYTTIKIGSQAKFFVVVKDKDELLEALFWAKKRKLKVLFLGGGSNVLITKKFNGLVIKNEIKGIKIKRDNKKSAVVEALSGEIWSKVVNFCVDNKLYGAENLFLIPGTVGAAPMQNIGAYGVELKDIFYSLVAINIKTGKEKIFKLKDCHFGYRNSVFKNKLRNKYFIYSLSLRLSKEKKFNLNYGAIKDKLAGKKVNLHNVIQAIQDIRNSKIPNPVVLANSGSFFKNPIISKTKFLKLQKKYNNIPFYELDDGKIKIPAAWLIEQAGFKGRKIKGVGMYEKQALILVNYGEAKAKDVISLVKKIKEKVNNMFNIKLEEEVNII